MFAVTTANTATRFDARALLDFSGVLERAVDLLKKMDEFARSRYRLSRATTTCSSTSFRTRAGRNGSGGAVDTKLERRVGRVGDALPPSTLIVGDRKQAIYGFRDAEVALLGRGARFIATCAPN